ncbi:MAG TPA: outer membrane lipoprotein carrier protein LolA [Kofleriaceae bacterium]
MKRALLVVAIAAAPAFAQPAGQSVTPQQAIDKVEATYAAAKGVTAKLDQTNVNATMGQTTTSKATLVEDHGKFAADYTNKKDKLDKSFLYDGTDLWYVEHIGLKATQTPVNSNALPAVLELLSGAKGAIAKQFTIAAPKNPSSLVPGATVIELTPKASSASYKTIDVVLDPTKWTVTRTIVTDPQGNTTTYELSNVDLDAKIDAKKFTFDPTKFPTYQIKKLQPATATKTPANKP